MSGIFKSIMKFLPIVLGAAAVVFTGGAALGLLPMFGATSAFGALGGALTSILGTGTLATIATGAITTAAFGSLAGGAVAGVTGGDISKGMTAGMVAGAAAGGIGAGLGLIGGAAAPAAAAASPIDAATAATAGAAPVTAVTTAALPNIAGAAGAAGVAPAVAAAAPAAAAGGGLLSGSGLGSYIGPALVGLGSSLGQENQTDINKQQQDYTAANYGSPTVGNGGLLTQVAKPEGLRPPQQAFNPQARYVFDNSTKKLVLVNGQTPSTAIA